MPWPLDYCPTCRDTHPGGVHLPEFLERVGGDIRIAGSRVSFSRVADAFFQGKSIGDMKEMFPMVPSRTLLDAMRFCAQHIELVREHHLERQAGLELRRAVSDEVRREIDRALAGMTEAADEDAKRGLLTPGRIDAAIREFRSQHPY